MCKGKKCHHLKSGEISVCTLPHFIHRLNEHFDTNLPTEAGNFNIYDKSIDANPWKFEEKLNSAFELCKYCGTPVYFEWGRADEKRVRYEDWFIE